MPELLTADTGSFAGSIGSWVEITAAANFTTTHSTAEGGIMVLEVTTGGSNIAVGSHNANATDKPAVTPGDTLTFAIPVEQVDGVARNYQTAVNFYDSSDVAITVSGSANVIAGSGALAVGSTVVCGGSLVVPAGAATCRARFRIDTPAAAETFHVKSASLVSTSPNTGPTASAGADQTVASGSVVTLTGTDSDSDGTIASRTWTQTAGSAVTLSGTGATRTFAAPTGPATLTFSYTVTDDDGATASDSVTITVSAPVNKLTDDDTHFTSSVGRWRETNNPNNFAMTHSTEEGGVMQIQVNVGGATISVGTATNASPVADKVPVTPGEILTLSFRSKYLAGAAGRSQRIQGRFFTDLNVLVGDADASGMPVTMTATWGTVTGTMTVPAGAAYMRPEIDILTPEAGDLYLVDDFVITSSAQAPRPTPLAGEMDRFYLSVDGPILLERLVLTA